MRDWRFAAAISVILAGFVTTASAQTNAAQASPAASQAPPPTPRKPDDQVGGSIDAARQFNINGQRVLGFDGTQENLFVGGNAGTNTTGAFNAFAGAGAGIANIAGQANSYFGARAGQAVQMGNSNAAFGFEAGTGGIGPNSTASENSFFGFQAGRNVYSGSRNVYVGTRAGTTNSDTSDNTGVGWHAGGAGFNSYFQGSSGTFIGSNARPGDHFLANAAAIGANAQVDQANSLVLGAISGVNGGTDTRIGIGTTAPTEKLHIKDGQIRWANSLLNQDHGGSIELGGANALAGTGTPYIDFHLNGFTQDYNVRLVNDLDGWLALDGNLYVTGQVQTGVSSPVGRFSGAKRTYDGIATLDEKGEAVVQLPTSFDAGGEFRYQLTCLLGYAPVYISQEIEGDQFRIAGGTSGLKVSWQVTAPAR